MEKKANRKMLIVLAVVLVCLFGAAIGLLLGFANSHDSVYRDGNEVRYTDFEELPPIDLELTEIGEEHSGIEVSDAVRATSQSSDGYTLGMKKIKAAMKSHKTTLKLSPGQVTENQFYKIVNNLYNTSAGWIYCDTWGLDQFETCWMVSYGGKRYMTEINMSYFLTAKQVESARTKVTNIAKKAKAQANGSKQAKIKYIHNYLVKNTAYATAKSADWEKIDSTKAHGSYGCLLKHRAYCSGYALAFARIAKASGIQDVRYVVCEAPGGGLHAINRVKQGDKWYYYDCTWDDPLINNSDQGKNAIISYDYYKKTKTQMVNYGYRFNV